MRRILLLDPIEYKIIADLLENSPDTMSAARNTEIKLKYGENSRAGLTKSPQKKLFNKFWLLMVNSGYKSMNCKRGIKENIIHIIN